MTIALKGFVKYLDDFLEVANFADSCPNGLQVEGASSIQRIATAVTANLETIQAAIHYGAQALIVHHGLFWNGDSPVVTGVKQHKLKLLLENNISLLAYHLPLDAHKEVGNNWKAAKDLGWTDLQPFGIYKGVAIGVKGRFPKMERDQFKNALETYYQHQSQIALGGKEIVQSAALVSGGAYRSISEAADEELDCFVTGNFDEPAWYLAKERGINFFAEGHSATEVVGPKALGAYLQSYFGIEYQFLDIHNPF